MSHHPIAPLRGYHHLTMVTRDARENARFYRDLLRLRLVKQTVDLTMPDVRHVCYGDEIGAPGSPNASQLWVRAFALRAQPSVSERRSLKARRRYACGSRLSHDTDVAAPSAMLTNTVLRTSWKFTNAGSAFCGRTKS